MIIGISGKKQSGKNTVADIINYLIALHSNPKEYLYYEDWIAFKKTGIPREYKIFEQKSFAHKIKVFVASIIGCSLEDLEDEEFKNTELGEEWRVYEIFDYVDGEEVWIKCSKSTYAFMNDKYASDSVRTYIHTPRTLLQQIGTDVGRNVHSDIWVNALMSEYYEVSSDHTKHINPDWIITDVRFPNELEAIEDKRGFVIRVKRGWIDEGAKVAEQTYIKQHESETALDKHEFVYEIDNNGTIEELIEKVKLILIKERIINGINDL